MPESKHWFYPEAAAFLRKPVGSLRKDVMRGKVPCHHPYGPKGRCVFFPEELEAFLRGEKLLVKGGAE
jgi:hypothetical protein